MSGVEVVIKIEIRPSARNPSVGCEAERLGDGYFRLVLDGEAELDIDALEAGLLRTNYPALRTALASYLEAAIKKSRATATEPRS
jgi:hypothetical protein